MNFMKFGLCATLIFVLTAFAKHAEAAPSPSGTYGLQHAGAVYFYAQPGMLEITLWKRDASGSPTERALTAVLAGPDGTIFKRIQLIAPAGEIGQRVEATLQAKVLRAGVYTLLLSANSDQYLSVQTIGFSTNAAQYLISSGAGHTDTARQEPIILNGADKPFSIFFKPSQNAFKVQFSGLPKNTKTIEMHDAAGKLVRVFDADAGKAETSFAVADGARDGVWELRLPSQKGSVLIESLNTVWNKNEKPLPVWTTSRAK